MPTRPVINPEIPPPKTSQLDFAGKTNFSFSRNKIDRDIKNIPKISLRSVCDRLPTNIAPIVLRRKLGTPKSSTTVLSIPCLKNVILPKSPKILNIATKTKAVLKLTKYDANGREIVDEPEPAIVSITSERKPIMIMMIPASSKMFITTTHDVWALLT